MDKREKVIKRLGRVSNDIVDGYITEPDMACNTINDAIDLLKTLKLCDDAISRSALLAAYDEAHKGPPGGARKLIEEAPAVEPKVHEPKMVIGIAEIYKDILLGNCPSCDQSIVSNANKSTKYCRFCGQAVKWDA